MHFFLIIRKICVLILPVVLFQPLPVLFSFLHNLFFDIQTIHIKI